MVLQVEILRNAISYIQSLEKCLGINFEDERKENVVSVRSSKESEEDNDYKTFKCLEADESVTSISVPLQDRASRTSSKHLNRKIIHINKGIDNNCRAL